MDAARTSTGRTEFEDFFICSTLLSTRAARYVVPVLPSTDVDVDVDVPAVSFETQKVVRRLSESLVLEIIDPFLNAASRDACGEIISEKIADFVETLDAVRVVLSKSKHVPDERGAVAQKLVTTARSLYGEAGAEEAMFATETFASAVRITGLLEKGAPPAGTEARDRELVQSFHFHAAIYGFAFLAIQRARVVRPASECAKVFAIELLRHGAMECYAIAREAFDLRSADPTANACEWLPMDDEDFALAMVD